MRMRFDNIVTLLDRAKLLKQTSLFELNETIIFGDMHSLSSINPSIHPSIHLAIRPSIHPSVHPSHFVFPLDLVSGYIWSVTFYFCFFALV